LIASNGGATTAGAAMYGDGQELLHQARGGNDTLISGSGNDQMWGDATIMATTAHTGADTFIFSNGHDTVMDFQRGQDHIELKGYVDITNFSQPLPHIIDTTAGSVITFDSNNSILVANDHHKTRKLRVSRSSPLNRRYRKCRADTRM
jgi:Ca2+-binding RTX toxin-like protein